MTERPDCPLHEWQTGRPQRIPCREDRGPDYNQEPRKEEKNPS